MGTLIFLGLFSLLPATKCVFSQSYPPMSSCSLCFWGTAVGMYINAVFSSLPVKCVHSVPIDLQSPSDDGKPGQEAMHTALTSWCRAETDKPFPWQVSESQIHQWETGRKWIIGLRQNYYVDVAFLEVFHRNQVLGLSTIGGESEFFLKKKTEKK